MSSCHPAARRVTLLVIAKEPVPGRVRTRLTPPCTPGEAAALAKAAVTDTLHAVLRAPARRRALVLDGAPGAWLPPGFDVVPQQAGGLDERIAAAFAHCDRGPALLVGMDAPQLTPELLSGVGRGGHDAWFGPAVDSGALGLAHPGLGVSDLPVLRDVDTAADVVAVAACCPPGSRFATTMNSLAERGR